jgi:hypothetical protein
MTTQHLRPIFGVIAIFWAALSSNAGAQSGLWSVNTKTTTSPDTESFWLPPHGVDVPMYHANDHGDCPVVEVMVNGHGPYRFAVETGAGFSAISPDVVKAAGLSDNVIADSISIGSAQLRHFAMTQEESPVKGLAGFLGLDAFQDLLLTVDFPHSRVRLERGTLPAANGRDVLPIYPTLGSLIGFDIQVANKRVSALLDTQSDAIFNEPLGMVDTLAFVKPPVVVGSANGPSIGDNTGIEGRLKGDIRVGDLTFDRPVIFIAAGFPKWLVGAGALRYFVLTLDQRHSLVRFTQSQQTHVAAPPPLRMIGWGMSVHDGNRVVEKILPGGEAELKGVQLGDVIVSVNGHPAGAIDDSTFLTLSHGNKPLQIVARRGTETRKFTLIPRTVIP